MLLILLACVQELSGSCEGFWHCSEDEVCAKGVCMNAPCDANADCSAGWECGTAMGSNTCLLACGEDADCIGEAICRAMPVSSDPQAETADYCL